MTRKFNTVWPLPIYVATFADGDTQRLSFGSPANKPLAFERGRNMACHFARKWLDENLTASLDRYYAMPARSDIVAGHVELNGQTFRDPHFDAPVAPQLRVINGSRRPTKVAYERIVAALPELNFDQLDELEKVLGEVINAKLAA